MLPHLFEWTYSICHTVLWALLVFGILVFIHEFGHYLVAKKLGIGVSCFSLGLGRRLWGFQCGETDYRVSLIPFGGYVKLVGENPEANCENLDVPVKPINPERSFYLRPVSHRGAVIFAGPLFNILLAVVLTWVLHIAGVPVLGSWVGSVRSASPAAFTGLREGDHIIGIDGRFVQKWTDMVQIIQETAGNNLLLRVERKDEILEIPIISSSATAEGEVPSYWWIGIGISSQMFIEQFGPLEALDKSLRQTYSIMHLTATTIYGMIVRTLPADIGGPLRISLVVGQEAKRGIRYVMMVVILLSLNLGILNLLPIPMLDGGHLALLAVEFLRGNPISLGVQKIIMQMGLVVLIGLMTFATYNDSVYYFWQWIR